MTALRRTNAIDALTAWGEWVVEYGNSGANGDVQEGGKALSFFTPTERIAAFRQRIDFLNPLGKRVDGIVQSMDSTERFVLNRIYVDGWAKTTICAALKISPPKLDKILHGGEMYVSGALNRR